MPSKTLISEKDVRHVASLAHLSLKKKEIFLFKNQLSNIFDYIGQIAKMDTRGVSETTHATGEKNRFRKDEVRRETMLSQDEALSQSKKIYKGYFVVKSIFER